MTCPKCAGASLTAVVVDGTEVDRCPECGGVWFDKGELGEALRHDPRALAPIETPGAHPGPPRGPAAVVAGDPDERAGRCPRDGRRLLRVDSARRPAVTVDECPVCRGIWLDGGELAALRATSPGVPLGDLI